MSTYYLFFGEEVAWEFEIERSLTTIEHQFELRVVICHQSSENHAIIPGAMYGGQQVFDHISYLHKEGGPNLRHGTRNNFEFEL